MDIRHLRTFVTVVRLGSVTRAAEALHITQPAVSGQLKSLEAAIGLRLLERTTTSLALTQAGTELLGRAEQALTAFGDFVHAARSFRGAVAGTIRLGLPMMDLVDLRIGAFMAVMVERHRAVKIDLRIGRTVFLRDGLHGAELDASLYVSRTLPPEMQGFPLRPVTYRFAVPRAWAACHEGAGWQELERLPLVRVTPGSTHGEVLRDLLDQTGMRPLETVEADHELLICELVAAGIGFGVVREELALRPDMADRLALFGEARAEVMLRFIHPAERASDPVIGAMGEVLRQVWQV
ncbi:LysR family transcriptional regulator [Aquabacter sp. L1I39]|uniref:LysR family transcriptional regulator n=1 Tax=Aquabacter sp. L1I39 TaxID=2820278 RepID=UPI001ADC76C7|nr:LysR family transcriptional regulator [Aquabacter sp. L1I39]QTL04162.1 LysR family transcriptional regulator [Aquabacter sp. L1I39]